MGWDGADDWNTITDVKNDIRASVARAGHKILGEAGSAEFWYVIECAETPYTKAGERLLLLSLIERRGRSYMKKDMDESMFPYYYKCPDRLLALVGEPKTEDAKKWRAWRLAQMAKTSKTWNPGDEFLVFGDAARKATVVGQHGRGYVYLDASGKRWKIQPKDMEPVTCST